MMNITKTTIIKSSPKKVYEAYVSLETWLKAIKEVVDIKVFYDDSIHQEFDMKVNTDRGVETVHSIRFCFPYQSVEIFQTQPPPMFNSMSGIWTFNSCSDGTILTGIRNFDIKKGVNFDVKVLEGFLEKNLTSFKNWIENHGMCEC